MAESGLSSAARFLPGDKTLRAAGNPQGVAAAWGSRKFQDASSPHSPARQFAPSTPRARHRAAGSSEDGAAQGEEHVQALVPLNVGRMGSYQPMLRRVPRCQEPLTPATARPLEPFGGSSRIFDQK